MTERNSVIPMPTEYSNLFLLATCHLGGQSLNHKMSGYVFKRRKDKVWVFNIQTLWEKLITAARMIVSVEDRKKVVIVSTKKFGFRPVTLLADSIGATAVTGNFVPGTFTNKSTKSITEPRLIITVDPFTDKQTIKEASYINVPCISLANTDNDIELIDCVIPCNNRSAESIGSVIFALERLVKYMLGEIDMTGEIRLLVDKFFFKAPEEMEIAMRESEKGKESEESEYEEGEWEEGEKAEVVS